MNWCRIFTSLIKNQEPHLASSSMCISLFLTFVHSISQKARGMVSQRVWGWLLFLLRGPFSMDLLEAAPVFVCWELGESAFRGTDQLALVGNESVFTVCIIV